ncbi:hypothetical protein Y032_0063g3439 [Ancylostoma ceylanicum]|uniref:Secreted protein n=1 Tax=Ancylostoma ceylanicum TaxID=53326 RepID=A0A016U2U9_9BILA|nr:hypothetical protein Y032_0063g3439 [Ancylostoma ceylanicum]
MLVRVVYCCVALEFSQLAEADNQSQHTEPLCLCPRRRREVRVSRVLSTSVWSLPIAAGPTRPSHLEHVLSTYLIQVRPRFCSHGTHLSFREEL